MWRILPSSCSFVELADLLLQRHLLVDAVQLEEVDRLEAEPAQAQLALLAQVLGPADRPPVPGPRPGQPGLGRDHQIVAVRVKGLVDQPLGHLGPVGVGGVDEVDARLDGAAQDGDGFVAVIGLSPDALPGQLHGAVAESVDLEVAAELEGAGGGRGGGAHEIRSFLVVRRIIYPTTAK